MITVGLIFVYICISTKKNVNLDMYRVDRFYNMYISYRLVMYRKNLDYHRSQLTEHLHTVRESVSYRSNRMNVIENQKVYIAIKIVY